MPFDAAQDDVRRVREAADIVQVVSDHVALKPKGREYVGLCPFHDDRNPSMSVVPNKQIFHCFVCQTGGDVFSFLQKLHGMSFPEALQHLAERFGVQLTPRQTRQGPRRDQQDDAVSRADIIAANHTAANFFKTILNHPEHGAAAREVIINRKIDDEMVQAFALGAAPDRWDGLVALAQSKDLPIRNLAAAGLVKPRESGGHYDAFRHRLVFPIHDQTGRVIAFGARKIRDEDEPKYLNSPEHAAFDKSSTLFGLYQARKGIQRANTVLVTEGYTDVIACHQHGFDYAVAALGTAFTPQHAKVLERLLQIGGRIILLFDSDDAGQRAADRATQILFTLPIDIRFAAFSDDAPAKDPDELLKQPDGDAHFQRIIDNAQDLLTFRFNRLRARFHTLDPTGRAALVEQEIKNLAELGIRRLSPIRKQLVLDQLAELTALPRAQIAELIRAHQPHRHGPEPAYAEPQSPRRPQTLTDAQHALGCILADPALHFALERADLPLLAPDAYTRPDDRAVAHCVEQIAGHGAQPALDAVLDATHDPSAKDAAVHLLATVTRITEAKPQRLTALFNDCIARLRDAADARRPETPRSPAANDELAQRIDALKKRGPDNRRLPKARPAQP